MTLRSKLVIGFIGILCFVFTVSTLIINERLVGFTLEDQKVESERAVQQTASASAIVFSDIEAVLYQSHSDMKLAQTLSDDSTNATVRERNLISKLRYICYNNNYFDALLLIDEAGIPYVGAISLYETVESFCKDIQTQIAASKDMYTAWFQDQNGNIYVKKDVYRITPLYRAGILIARIDKDILTSLLGYKNDENAMGISAILCSSAMIISDKPLDQKTAKEVFDKYLDGKNAYSGFIVLQDREYWLTAKNIQNNWYAIRMLKKTEMLRSPDFVRNVSICTVFVCAAFSILMAWVLCHSMTRNIQKLNQGMDKVGDGDFSVRIPIQAKDEVGQLTCKFNAFVEQLKNTTQQMVNQATAKQQIELEMMDLRYRSLQTQISPHYICNILESIKGLNSLGRKEELSRLLVLTSRYLRNNLTNSDIRFVSISQEITVIEEYLQIFEQVYRQKICLEIDMPKELENCLVPSLILLPLVENSIQHGRNDHQKSTDIKLRVRRKEERLILYVCDNGSGIEPKVLQTIRESVTHPSKNMPGFGIRSVLMRLRLLYGNEHQFIITSKEGLTAITIWLPYQLYEQKKES